MTGRGIEKLGLSVIDGMHNLAETLLHNAQTALQGSLHADEVVRIIEAGVTEPGTFSPRTEDEEGGRSRFLPALSMGVSAVRGAETPEEIFEELHGHLKELKGGIKKSEKTTSTRAIVRQLAESGLDILDGITIEECAPAPDRITRSRQACHPLSDDYAALVVPLHWKIFREEREIPEDYLSVPLWAAATGGEKLDGGSRHRLERDPNCMSYTIAFPVRPPDAAVGEGLTRNMPGITFHDLFTRPQVELPNVPAQLNIAYKVSAVGEYQ